MDGLSGRRFLELNLWSLLFPILPLSDKECCTFSTWPAFMQFAVEDKNNDDDVQSVDMDKYSSGWMGKGLNEKETKKLKSQLRNDNWHWLAVIASYNFVLGLFIYLSSSPLEAILVFKPLPQAQSNLKIGFYGKEDDDN